MAGFCRKCGSPLGKNAMFCKKCGTRVVSIQSSQTVQEQVQPPKIQCRNCGYSLKEGAVFCKKCGTKVTDYQVVQPTIKETQNLQGTKVQHNQQQSIRTFESQKDQHYEQTASVNYAQPQQSILQNQADEYAQPQQNTFQNEAVRYAWQAQQQFTQNVQGMIQPMFADAADRAGETALQLPQLQSALGFADEAKAVLDPFTQFFTGISGFFKGIINVFKDPKALTFSAVLSFIWMILIFMKQLGIGGVFTNALSWITFAQGGLGDGALGILGGFFGKMVVASGLFALIDGGKDIGEGMKKWFNCFNDISNIGAVLTGEGLSLILYNFFVANAGFGDTMVAITGAILALQALGSQNGFIFGMARSIMSRKLGNNRIPNVSKANAFVSGIGLGSALAIPLSLLPFGYIPCIIGIPIFIVGIVLNFTIRGKEAQTV